MTDTQRAIRTLLLVLIGAIIVTIEILMITEASAYAREILGRGPAAALGWAASIGLSIPLLSAWAMRGIWRNAARIVMVAALMLVQIAAAGMWAAAPVLRGEASPEAARLVEGYVRTAEEIARTAEQFDPARFRSRRADLAVQRQEALNRAAKLLEQGRDRAADLAVVWHVAGQRALAELLLVCLSLMLAQGVRGLSPADVFAAQSAAPVSAEAVPVAMSPSAVVRQRHPGAVCVSETGTKSGPFVVWADSGRVTRLGAGNTTRQAWEDASERAVE